MRLAVTDNPDGRRGLLGSHGRKRHHESPCAVRIGEFHLCCHADDNILRRVFKRDFGIISACRRIRRCRHFPDLARYFDPRKRPEGHFAGHADRVEPVLFFCKRNIHVQLGVVDDRNDRRTGGNDLPDFIQCRPHDAVAIGDKRREAQIVFCARKSRLG